MQQVIGNVRFDSSEPMKVIEVRLLPIVLIALTLMLVLFGSLWVSNARAQQQLAQQAHVDMLLAEALEQVYATAQIDALEGRLRVIPTDGDYMWIESPWENAEPKHRYISQYGADK